MYSASLAYYSQLTQTFSELADPEKLVTRYLHSIFDNTYIFVNRLNGIEVLGTRYKCGGIVVLSVNLLPNFGLISDIIILDVDNYFLDCETLHTICFNFHFHSYEICHHTSPSFVFVKQSDLIDHSVLAIYKKTTDFVTLKYHVIKVWSTVHS